MFNMFLIIFPPLKGPRCSEPCSDGLWGRHCNQTCFKHCPNSDTCHRETGACVCRPGYWGVTCQNSECSSQSVSQSVRGEKNRGIVTNCLLLLLNPRMPSGDLR